MIIIDAVHTEGPELGGHEDGDRVEEGIQVGMGYLFALVTLVEDVLYLREPPERERGGEWRSFRS